MRSEWTGVPSRRAVMTSALVAAGALAVPGAAVAAMPADAPLTSPRVVRPELMRRALAALQQHRDRIEHRDRIGIVDFAAASSEPRFHFVDLGAGQSRSMLVAHGSGSDPAHSGWLTRFSNQDGSNASSEGAFLAADYYNGKHGRSQRLHGLDPTNSNALQRNIVLHSAWYSNPDMVARHGMLGRSQGCFAVGERELDRAFALLGPGRMIYAAKV